MWGQFREYVPVHQRRAKAAKVMAERRKKGEAVSPVEISGRKIATTFWGNAWCDNLESYSDFANRMPRGRTYVRNGSVVNLQIKAGKVIAHVSGSALYSIEIAIEKLEPKLWNEIKKQCAGQIGSVVELLQGKLSRHVMDVVTSRPGGLFPKPSEIKLKCSCPDWATMCKHVAAALYGVGARLDHQPELLFQLRQVDHLDLILSAGKTTGLPTAAGESSIADDEIAAVFGIDLADGATTKAPNHRSSAVTAKTKSSNAKMKAPTKKTVAVKHPSKRVRAAAAKKPRRVAVALTRG